MKHTKKKMEYYSENQKREDLAILGIEEGRSLTSRFLTATYKNLAKIHHPDRKGGEK